MGEKKKKKVRQDFHLDLNANRFASPVNHKNLIKVKFHEVKILDHLVKTELLNLFEK